MSEIENALTKALGEPAKKQAAAIWAEAAGAVAGALAAEGVSTVASLARQSGLLAAAGGGQSAAEAVNAIASGATGWAGGGLANTARTLALGPLVSGILGLFGGDDRKETPEFETYTAPDAIHLAAAATRGAGSPLALVEYGADGLPRLIGYAGSEAAAPRETRDLAGKRAAGTGATSITVNVQAIDSRSFLDHSDAIAAAVREAILNAHPLGDVIKEI